MGGTKIEITVINHNGIEVFRRRIPTPKDDYQSILKAIAKLISSTEEAVQEKCSIGVCTPGSLSPTTNLLRNSNTICLNDQPFKQDLENILNRGVRIANDANCFALSEAVDGAAKDAHSVFGVIIGTGTGAGLVMNKQVLIGENSITGEWGHNPLPWPEEGELALTKCWCGHNGCIETFLSGPGFENDYQRRTKEKLSVEKIIALAKQGDFDAEQTLYRYEHRMARALAHVINIFDPNMIVLGGGMSNIQRLYKNVSELWGDWIFSDSVTTRLVPAKYGDSSGVRGAAWLWD